jgi:DNA-binding LacI/PurR family transcriptional regulator
MSTRHKPAVDDEAKAPGVSRPTGSTAVNDRDRVFPDRRDLVPFSIQDLEYRPLGGAPTLRWQHSGWIAHPLPAGELTPANMIMLEFIHALSTAASRRNHHLLLAAGDDSGLRDIRELIGSAAVDAFVLTTVAPHDPRIALLARRGIPFASFGRTEPGMPQSWVDIDNRSAASSLTTGLIRQGHSTVAFLGYAPQGRWDVEREGGYQDALTAADLPTIAATPEPDGPAVQHAIDALLDGNRPPTAIVTGSDVLAAAVYAAAAARGIQIGTDLAVTGFDGSLIGRMLTPALTTLAIPTGDIAERLVDRVLRELEEPSDEPGELIMPELVVGASASLPER